MNHNGTPKYFLKHIRFLGLVVEWAHTVPIPIFRDVGNYIGTMNLNVLHSKDHKSVVLDTVAFFINVSVFNLNFMKHMNIILVICKAKQKEFK
jgi:hypothetical protein